MAVFALWSAPRTRSTAFFRSMAERGDMTVLHEPFCNLRDYGETEAGSLTFASPRSLLAWLRDETQDTRVFLTDWHADVSASSGFERRERAYRHTAANSAALARFAAHHRPFYEQLYAQRLDVTPWEHAQSP